MFWSNLSFKNMKDGGVDTTVIESRKHKMSQMADISLLFASSGFDLTKHDVPQIKSHNMRHALMNLVNTTLFEKKHLWVCTKFMCLHIPVQELKFCKLLSFWQ